MNFETGLLYNCSYMIYGSFRSFLVFVFPKSKTKAALYFSIFGILYHSRGPHKSRVTGKMGAAPIVNKHAIN